MTLKWFKFIDNSKLCIQALYDGAEKATEKFAYDITNAASANVTGGDSDLKRSISTQQNEGKQFKVLGAKSPKEYANFSVNVPLNPLQSKQGHYSKDFGAYAPWAMRKEFGDPAEGIVPEPFMRPAIDEVASRGDSDLAASIKRELNKHHRLKE